MFRRFAEGYERPSPDQLHEWFQGEMVSVDGTILCDEAYVVLREFFHHPDSPIGAFDLGRRIFMDPFQARSLCRQLVVHDVLEESPAFSTKYQIARHRLSQQVFERLRSQLVRATRRAA